MPAYNAEDFLALQKSSFAPFLKDLAFRWHAGQVMLDLILITVCYYAAYRLRFEGEDLDNFLHLFHGVAADRAGVQDRGAVRLRPVPAFLGDVRAARSVGCCARRGRRLAALRCRGVLSVPGRSAASRVVFVLDAILLAVAIIATRVSFRMMNLAAATRNKRSRRVLVYGAGKFGRMLVREMRANTAWNMNPVAFIDDDPRRRIAGSLACRFAARSTASRRRCSSTAWTR